MSLARKADPIARRLATRRIPSPARARPWRDRRTSRWGWYEGGPAGATDRIRGAWADKSLSKIASGRARRKKNDNCSSVSAHPNLVNRIVLGPNSPSFQHIGCLSDRKARIFLHNIANFQAGDLCGLAREDLSDDD